MCSAVKPHQQALARRRGPALRAPLGFTRPVRRVPVAQRRAAVIAAGPNKSVGWGAQFSLTKTTHLGVPPWLWKPAYG